MKHALLIGVLLLAAPIARAQKAKADASVPVLPVDPDTRAVTYTGVVEAPGATKAQLYARGLEWMARTYQSANDAVQLKDAEQGKLVAKGFMVVTLAAPNVGMAMLGVPQPSTMLLEQTLSLYLKDGRYKYVLTDLSLKGVSSRDVTRFPLDPAAPIPGFSKKAWAATLAKVDQQVQAEIASLDAALQAKGKDPSDF
ncbi:DUF4468 domain-containing protein [Hymenobacter sp. ASUV-10]|uniref:DUF4468 domain-containing protein n=1 Tax=Hymenobacter aranciens TaxID=3063996 RepID=A0ABT9B7E8_9BACT|nr:DUF4468 domain-containing protein [Hymenobacter sp. ASUV-10]MDO7874097.1 DUF4468 domain-containing protein [Hymenobacter sp. ASUV-10]